MLSKLSKSVIFSTKITVKMSCVTSSSLSSLHNAISLQYKILNHFFLMVCLFFCKYDILYVCYLDIIWFFRYVNLILFWEVHLVKIIPTPEISPRYSFKVHTWHITKKYDKTLQQATDVKNGLPLSICRMSLHRHTVN